MDAREHREAVIDLQTGNALKLRRNCRKNVENGAKMYSETTDFQTFTAYMFND